MTILLYVMWTAANFDSTIYRIVFTDYTHRYDESGCQDCVTGGCSYCVLGNGVGICSSPTFAEAIPLFCLTSGGTAYSTICEGGEGTVPNDDCDISNDPCFFPNDGECDANGSLCPINSDCFDCDPFRQFGSLGCGECTSNGGSYCQTSNGEGICSSPQIATALPSYCQDDGGTAYTATCEPISDMCDAANDSCEFANDGECDAGIYCAPNSDCYDCSPCTALRFDGCDACTAAGCLWCAADAACFPDYGWPLPSNLGCAAADFVSTCRIATNTNPFSDPLYESSNWIFDMIRVKPVWESGISKY